MKLTLLLGVVLLLCLMIAEAKKDGAVRNKNQKKKIKFERTKIGKGGRDRKSRERKERVKGMVEELKDDRKQKSNRDSKGNSLEKRSVKQNKKGKTTRMKQYHKGVRVYGAEVISNEVPEILEVEVSDKGTGAKTKIILQPELKLSGTFSDIESVDEEEVDIANYDPQSILASLKADFESSVEVQDRKKDFPLQYSMENAELIWYKPDAEEDSILAYHISFMARTKRDLKRRKTLTRSFYILDADTEEIIKQWESLRKLTVDALVGRGPGGNVRTGKYHYGTERPFLEVEIDDSGDYCKLKSSKVWTYQYPWDGPDKQFEFPYCSQSFDQDYGSFSSMNDAHYHATRTANMFSENYDPLSGTLAPIVIIAHDASWGGNAVWTGDKIEMGTGDTETFPFGSSMDIMAHEIGHGLTEQLSSLEYKGESAAIDEAFSDMTAKMVERYVKGKWGVQWTFAADVMRAANKSLRCIDNPKCDDWSLDHMSQYQPSTLVFNPHKDSGIFRKVFYLMSQKLAWDVWDAYDIFYVANRNFWTPILSFTEAAEGVLEATDELRAGKHLIYSYVHLNVAEVIDAFKQVGIACFKDDVGTSYTCFDI